MYMVHGVSDACFGLACALSCRHLFLAIFSFSPIFFEDLPRFCSLLFHGSKILRLDSLAHPLRPAPLSLSAQEFFRGSLSKNPLFSTDIVPSSAAAASGGGGRSGGGAAAASAAAGPSSSTISGVAEATMRDLRDKIATDLDMADAVRALPHPAVVVTTFVSLLLQCCRRFRSVCLSPAHLPVNRHFVQS